MPLIPPRTQPVPARRPILVGTPSRAVSSTPPKVDVQTKPTPSHPTNAVSPADKPKLVQRTLDQPPLRGEWAQRSVVCYLKGKKTTQRVLALCYGSMAVHEGVPGDKGYALTHIETGLSIVLVDVKEDAQRIGEYLWSKCCLAFRKDTPEAVKEKLPDWVEEWVGECRRQRKYVPRVEG